MEVGNVRFGSKADIEDRSADVRFTPKSGMSALPPKADISCAPPDVCFVPCVDGSELARTFLTIAALVGAAMCSAFACGSHDRWP
jgi:hypothetical protein